MRFRRMLAAVKASMRPRHKAAENRLQRPTDIRPHLASMRPRHKAAENRKPLVAVNDNAGGFNEAAA